MVGTSHSIIRSKNERPFVFFSEYKKAAWGIYRGEFPNGAERERELKDKCLDYATVMHYVDVIVGIDRDIDYWKN